MGLQSLSVQGLLYHKAGLSIVPEFSLSFPLKEAGASAWPDHPTLVVGRALHLLLVLMWPWCLTALSPRRQMNLAWNQGPLFSPQRPFQSEFS